MSNGLPDAEIVEEVIPLNKRYFSNELTMTGTTFGRIPFRIDEKKRDSLDG